MLLSPFDVTGKCLILHYVFTAFCQGKIGQIASQLYSLFTTIILKEISVIILSFIREQRFSNIRRLFLSLFIIFLRNTLPSIGADIAGYGFHFGNPEVGRCDSRPQGFQLAEMINHHRRPLTILGRTSDATTHDRKGRRFRLTGNGGPETASLCWKFPVRAGRWRPNRK